MKIVFFSFLFFTPKDEKPSKTHIFVEMAVTTVSAALSDPSCVRQIGNILAYARNWTLYMIYILANYIAVKYTHAVHGEPFY